MNKKDTLFEISNQSIFLKILHYEVKLYLSWYFKFL